MVDAFILTHAIYSIVAVIDDCDETYNYWEPIHYQVFGTPAFQTWEYSGVYALRTYSFTTVYALIAWLVINVTKNKRLVFGAVRLFSALLTAYSLMYLSKGIKAAIGPRESSIFLIVAAASPGILQASAAVLPSSVCMCLVAVIYGSWMQDRPNLAIAGACIMPVLTAWPFALAALIPLGMSVLQTNGVISSVFTAIPCLALAFSVSMSIDWMYYGKLVVPWWNTFQYNATAGSAALYGVESATFYLKSLTLHFSVLLPLACALPLWSHRRRSRVAMVSFYGAALWIAAMTSMPHKEVRFLFHVYPLVALSAACALSSLPRVPRWTITIVFLLCSLSRLFAVVSFFGGAHRLWLQAYEAIPANSTVCMSNDWHLFHSHFLLPPGARLDFTKGAFDGQLPRHYTTSAATHTMEFNNMNREEMSRYVDPRECDFFVGAFEDLPSRGHTEEYQMVTCQKLLIPEKSKSPFRSWWIPPVLLNLTSMSHHLKFRDFCLWRRENVVQII